MSMEVMPQPSYVHQPQHQHQNHATLLLGQDNHTIQRYTHILEAALTRYKTLFQQFQILLVKLLISERPLILKTQFALIGAGQ
mgnify:CR=1 FL=1